MGKERKGCRRRITSTRRVKARIRRKDGTLAWTLSRLKGPTKKRIRKLSISNPNFTAGAHMFSDLTTEITWEYIATLLRVIISKHSCRQLASP